MNPSALDTATYKKLILRCLRTMAGFSNTKAHEVDELTIGLVSPMNCLWVGFQVQISAGRKLYLELCLDLRKLTFYVAQGGYCHSDVLSLVPAARQNGQKRKPCSRASQKSKCTAQRSSRSAGSRRSTSSA